MRAENQLQEVYDARTQGFVKVGALGFQHLFAMFGAAILDETTLNDLKRDHAVVVTLEDGGDGGFGEKIARFYGDSDVKVLVRGAAKQFADRYDYDDFMRQNGLTAEQLAAAVVAALR